MEDVDNVAGKGMCVDLPQPVLPSIEQGTCEHPEIEAGASKRGARGLSRVVRLVQDSR